MRRKEKNCITTAVFLLALLMISATILKANAASSITLTPATGEPGDSVTVEGTDFEATNNVGIGMGPEVTVTGEEHPITDTAIGGPDVYGPFTAKTLHYPIKPGSFSFYCAVTSDTDVVESDYYDTYGNGTLATTSTYAIDPFVNYVTGEFGRSSSSSWETFTVTFTANYTYYQFSLTSAAGEPTDGSGAFSVGVTVPDIWNGTEPVTAVDELGHTATSDFITTGSDVVPEPLTIGAIILLSSAALVVSFYWLRKKSTNKMVKYN
jgi:hypothetical protein